METRKHTFTSESVCEGHPDKVADQISDAILDAVLEKDPNGRVAVETMINTGLVMAGGEMTTKDWIDIPGVVRSTLKDIGYDSMKTGFDCKSCAILSNIVAQSPDIALGLGQKEKMEQGAGDQGMMFGYACRETPELMPMPGMLANKLMMMHGKVLKLGKLPYLFPDGKCQVSVEYENGKPVRIATLVVSLHHADIVTNDEVQQGVMEEIITPVIPGNLLDSKTRILVNPTGRFVVGGPGADCGLTGRKIIVDTYQGVAPHGGGAFSGKDPSKVDRSAAYMMRHVAKNIVAAGLADKVLVQVSYAIGHAKPVSVYVNTFGTYRGVDEEHIEQAIQKVWDLRPRAIIEYLDLLRPIYRKTAAYGHFGRELPCFTWEKTDRAEDLARVAHDIGSQANVELRNYA